MTTSPNAPTVANPNAASNSRQAINASLSSLAGKLDSLLESYGVSPSEIAKASTISRTAKAKPERTPRASVVPAAASTPEVPAIPAAASVVAAPTSAIAPGRTVEQPVGKAVDKPVETPVEKPVERSVDKPVATATAPATAASAKPQPEAARGVQAVAAAKRSSEFENVRMMIVDDEEVNILAVKHHLAKEGFRQFVYTTDPRESLMMLRNESPDVLLLDIKMPHVTGIDILRAKSLDQSLPYVPVIVLTASVDPVVKREALDLGAYDFLTKPVDPNDLIPRVRNAVVVKRHFDLMADEASRLEELVKQRTEELEHSRQQLILSLARAAEHRDNETGNHVIRVGQYAAIIAKELGWSESQVLMLEQAAQLHDVGKIGIPDAILFKPGKLDPHEFDIIKHHCAIGNGIINPFASHEAEVLRTHARIGGNILHLRGSPMLLMASRIAQSHHECWDGTGYPLGLAGEDIPLEGRITSVADVFDALSSRRPYKEPFPREKCFQILNDWRGTKFDPRVLDAFFKRSEEIIEVQLRLMDPAPALPPSAEAPKPAGS